MWPFRKKRLPVVTEVECDTPLRRKFHVQTWQSVDIIDVLDLDDIPRLDSEYKPGEIVCECTHRYATEVVPGIFIVDCHYKRQLPETEPLELDADYDPPDDGVMYFVGPQIRKETDDD